MYAISDILEAQVNGEIRLEIDISKGGISASTIKVTVPFADKKLLEGFETMIRKHLKKINATSH